MAKIMKIQKIIKNTPSDKSEFAINLIVFLTIYAFLLNYYKPELILLKTTASGGDMGSMNYLAKYMRDYLLPHGKIFGWSPGRWAGYPIFQWIFPLPYIIIALLSYLIPLEISFKIVAASGIFLLPLITFITLKIMKFKFPVPIIASILTLFFLFNEKNTVFGGNIPSVLAGEFSYSISFSIMILFLGLIYKTISEKKISLSTSIVYSFVFLTHLVTAVVATISSIYFLLTKDKRKFLLNFKLLLQMLGLGLLLISFWLVPAVLKIEYTTKYGRDWPISELKNWYPKEAIIFHILAAVGLLIAFKKRDRRIFYFVFIIIVSFICFLGGELFFTANIRFWPMLYFFVLLIASYTIGEVVANFKGEKIIPLIILLSTVIFIGNSTSFIGFWIKWNYEGFESKSTWPIYKGINDVLVNTPGRAYCDLSDENDKLGTPRAFESLPYFSGKPTLEGVYAQSSITSPFISYIQCEISHHCAGIPTVAGQERTTTYNIEDGTKHLKIFNVKYLIAIYDKLKSDLGNNPNWRLVKKFDAWEVYELLTHEGKYVTVPKYEPNLMQVKGDEWKKISLDWWTDLEKVDVPVAFVKEKTEEENKFKTEISDLSELKRISVENNCTINEQVLNEEIIFNTTCVGKPHIISVSYYPNWKVEGADKIYLVSPSFMLVFPNKTNVRLYYGTTTADLIGALLSFFGLLYLCFYFIKSSGRNG